MHSKTLVALTLAAAAVPSLAQQYVTFSARDVDDISELIAREPLIEPSLISHGPRRPINRPIHMEGGHGIAIPGGHRPTFQFKPTQPRINMPGAGGAGRPDRYNGHRLGAVRPREFEDLELIARDFDEFELVAREPLINPALRPISRPRPIVRPIHMPGAGGAGIPPRFGGRRVFSRDVEELLQARSGGKHRQGGSRRNSRHSSHAGHSGHAHGGHAHGGHERGQTGHHGHHHGAAATTAATEGGEESTTSEVSTRSLEELEARSGHGVHSGSGGHGHSGHHHHGHHGGATASSDEESNTVSGRSVEDLEARNNGGHNHSGSHHSGHSDHHANHGQHHGHHHGTGTAAVEGGAETGAEGSVNGRSLNELD
ncbi:hypothetical protein C8Q75DRAFT_804572 [Abortiporus biennis]|nr:hypothetical protein C8Q75DRAFT_804572 [Abortiporus biennis]